MNARLGKLLNVVVFGAALPSILMLWALRLDDKLGALPRVRSGPAGLAFAVLGAVLVLRAMWDLWRHGGGLPMSAYPPPRFVAAGIYRWLPHPIYAGFGLVVLGAMLALGSRAGVWIVTPVVWLAMVAQVVGFERIGLQQRFGAARPAPWLALPPNVAAAPGAGQRLATLLLAFGPWLLGYEGCALLGAPAAAFDTMMPFEHGWPVWEWTAVFYLGAYAWTLSAPFAATTQSALRHFAGTALWGTGLILWCFLVFPLVAGPRPIDPSSTLGHWLRLDRSFDTPACALPSFHVFWAFAAAGLWATRLGTRASRLVAVLIAVSCLTTGVHSLADVVTGWIAYLGASNRDAIWAALRRGTERVANSWRDWRLGPVRIINHGAYVGGATLLGLWLIGLLLGPALTPAIVTVALCALAGAGLWGQWLEASSQLSRPFGYFGGLFGGCAGMILVQFWRGEGWQVAGGYAVAASLIQGVGRLRCLVQGCCHGRPADAWLGIRYAQPLSRVCKLARLGGVPVHPTPLYSILANALILGLLVRLWFTGADLALVTGAYFILSTCARFMEEGYRGEPQTVRWLGLPIYQWLAIGCLLTGLVLTTLPAPHVPAWGGGSIAPLSYALPIGLLVWFAMGVDFPESNQRMSRLA
jgi:protein-S-isoprenylcysteine O-methyltransferase Ste14